MPGLHSTQDLVNRGSVCNDNSIVDESGESPWGEPAHDQTIDFGEVDVGELDSRGETGADRFDGDEMLAVVLDVLVRDHEVE